MHLGDRTHARTRGVGLGGQTHTAIKTPSLTGWPCRLNPSAVRLPLVCPGATIKFQDNDAGAAIHVTAVRAARQESWHKRDFVITMADGSHSIAVTQLHFVDWSARAPPQ